MQNYQIFFLPNSYFFTFLSCGFSFYHMIGWFEIIHKKDYNNICLRMTNFPRYMCWLNAETSYHDDGSWFYLIKKTQKRFSYIQIWIKENIHVNIVY